MCQGSKATFNCLAAHRANPAGGYKVDHEKVTGTSRSSGRRRRITIETLFTCPEVTRASKARKKASAGTSSD